jgi:hypothetical protein
MVGDVKCTVTPDNNDLIHEIKCADKEKVQIYSRDDAPPKAVIVSENQKSRFVFDNPANLANGNFTDETGKTVKSATFSKNQNVRLKQRHAQQII